MIRSFAVRWGTAWRTNKSIRVCPVTDNYDCFEVVSHPALDPPLNMAVDWWLLNHAEKPTLRFYGWAEPSLTIGYRQQFRPPDNLPELIEQWPSAVRPTGGGYLLHAGELTYSFVVPSDHALSGRSIMSFYGLIRDAFSRALLEAGVLSRVETGDSNLDSADCLEGPSDHEPILDGEKWMASAQVRHNGNILQHGSLYYDSSSWPSSWEGPRPGFLEMDGLSRQALIDCLVESVSEEIFSSVESVPRTFNDREWQAIKETAGQFIPARDLDHPRFRRSPTADRSRTSS